MVRRVIGASAAPTPDFSPFRAVTPAGGLTDFYRQPGTMAIPESEFSQVAQALQSISPTLSKVIGDTTEAANQAQADQGRMDAEKLTAEQARDAMRGNFIQMEKDNVIPQGASPFRLAAMQAALGKDLIENELRTELNNPATINRLTDPLKKEDPAKLVSDLFAEKTKSLGFYAQGAATDALDAVETAFLNKVSLLKGERITAKNREDFANSVYNTLRADPPPGFDPRQALLHKSAQIQASIDEHYKLTGESGAKEVMDGIRASAMALAKEGKGAQALNLILMMEGIELGGQSLGERSSIALQSLRENVDSADERSDEDERRERRQREEDTRTASKTVTALLFTEFSENGGYKSYLEFSPESGEGRKKIREMLEAQGLDEEQINVGLADVIQGTEANKRSVPIDEKELSDFRQALNDRSIPASVNRAALDQMQGRMDPRIWMGLAAEVDKKADRGNNLKQIRYDGSQISRAAEIGIETALKNAEFSAEITSNALMDYYRRVGDLEDQIISKMEDGLLTQEQASREYTSGIERIAREFGGYIEQSFDEDLSPDTPESIRRGFTRIREETQKSDAVSLPKESMSPASSGMFSFDSDFDDALLDLQSSETEYEDKVKAKNILLPSADTRLAAIRKDYMLGLPESELMPPMYFEGTLPPEVQAETLRIQIFRGFTLEEIKGKRTIYNVKIPEDALNPEVAILFPGITSVEQWRSFSNNTANDSAIKEVMKALPARYRLDSESQKSFDVFMQAQTDVFERYRP